VARYALFPEIAGDVLETKKSLLRRSEMLEFTEASEAFSSVAAYHSTVAGRAGRDRTPVHDALRGDRGTARVGGNSGGPQHQRRTNQRKFGQGLKFNFIGTRG
jgi:hypothetical protein